MTRHQKSKAWREKHGLSVDELAELTGYARESIYLFERGKTPTRPGTGAPRGKIKDWVWQRWQMACAGVDAELKGGRKFEW